MSKGTPKLTENQRHALRLIQKYGRTTDIRAAKRLAEMGLISIIREDRLPSPGWGAPGAKCIYAYTK